MAVGYHQTPDEFIYARSAWGVLLIRVDVCNGYECHVLSVWRYGYRQRFSLWAVRIKLATDHYRFTKCCLLPFLKLWMVYQVALALHHLANIFNTKVGSFEFETPTKKHPNLCDSFDLAPQFRAEVLLQTSPTKNRDVCFGNCCDPAQTPCCFGFFRSNPC